MFKTKQFPFHNPKPSTVPRLRHGGIYVSISVTPSPAAKLLQLLPAGESKPASLHIQVPACLCRNREPSVGRGWELTHSIIRIMVILIRWGAAPWGKRCTINYTLAFPMNWLSDRVRFSPSCLTGFLSPPALRGPWIWHKSASTWARNSKITCVSLDCRCFSVKKQLRSFFFLLPKGFNSTVRACTWWGASWH